MTGAIQTPGNLPNVPNPGEHNVLPWMLGGVGLLLIWGAIKGQNPLTILKTTLQTGSAPKAPVVNTNLDSNAPAPKPPSAKGGSDPVPGP